MYSPKIDIPPSPHLKYMVEESSVVRKRNWRKSRVPIWRWMLFPNLRDYHRFSRYCVCGLVTFFVVVLFSTMYIGPWQEYRLANAFTQPSLERHAQLKQFYGQWQRMCQERGEQAARGSVQLCAANSSAECMAAQCTSTVTTGFVAPQPCAANSSAFVYRL